jgi:G patch domain/KOW motif-containing protein
LCLNIDHRCRSNARPGFVPSFIPDAAGAEEVSQGIEHFQTAAHDTAEAQQDVTYGLIKRQNPADVNKKEKERSTDKPLVPPSEAEVLKLDLEQLPPEASLEAYEDMPVEAFGEALLRGMGWQEGRAIGRGNKKEVLTKDLIRRPHRLGLGAAPAPAPETHKKYIKPGESRAPQDNVYVDPSTGALKSTKDADRPSSSSGGLRDKKQLPGVLPGKVMEIVEGRHHGLQCEVQSLEPKEPGRSARAKVRLLPSYEVVVVRCSDLDEIKKGSSRGRDSSGREDRDRDREKGGGGSGGRESKRRKENSAKQPYKEEKEDQNPWLVPNIRVKIVDKRLHGGKFYLKKGIIVDVKAPTLCDVFIDGNKESVLDVRQSQLETVVPGTEGTPVQVLVGKYKGQRARLLQRNTSTGLAAIQLMSDMSVHKLSLDDISEYCGPTDGWDDS